MWGAVPEPEHLLHLLHSTHSPRKQPLLGDHLCDQKSLKCATVKLLGTCVLIVARVSVPFAQMEENWIRVAIGINQNVILCKDQVPVPPKVPQPNLLPSEKGFLKEGDLKLQNHPEAKHQIPEPEV